MATTNAEMAMDYIGRTENELQEAKDALSEKEEEFQKLEVKYDALLDQIEELEEELHLLKEERKDSPTISTENIEESINNSYSTY